MDTIVVVDDESIYREMCEATLTADAGFRVLSFASASEALPALERVEPALIISDIRMPEMDGFAFHRMYQEQFSCRLTPFIFLTSQSDPETIVRGLDAGVDDYLNKPLHPDILQAKVRSLLQRYRRTISQSYTGRLEDLPFCEIMRFCETSFLTGTVELASNGQILNVPFSGGEIALENLGFDIEQAFESRSGTFTIKTSKIDYRSLSVSQEVLAVSGGTSLQGENLTRLPGRLSGLQVGSRLLQLQTEYSDAATPWLESIAVLDGRILHKLTQEVTSKDLVSALNQQHEQLEADVRQRLEQQNQQPKGTDGPDFHTFYDQGYQEYCQGNYQLAVELWERAEKLNPDDKTLAVNLKVVRNKLVSISS